MYGRAMYPAYTRAMYSAPVCAYETMDINKDLVAATATPLVLAILAEGDSYGYAILKRVSELSGGELQWTDGMLYPVLHRLERQGHIKGKWGTSETGRKRKYYHLTARGQAQLAEQRRQWQMVDAALRNIWPAVSLSTRSALSPLPSHG
jgi:PadR family transcriptional regulator PadR